MMDFALRWFRLDPSWHPLFERLEHWTQVERNIWSDGRSVVKLAVATKDEPHFGFVAPPSDNWSRLRKHLGVVDCNENYSLIDATAPSGIRARFGIVEADANQDLGTSELFMNHISLNVHDLRTERLWYEQVLGSSVVLARDEVWEPVSRTFVQDVHLFCYPRFYVTLRAAETSCVDHVGWMATSIETVHRMAQIVIDLGWRIVFGPTEIDGCFLFHFEGPDGRVHDFFSPLSELHRRGLMTNERS